MKREAPLDHLTKVAVVPSDANPTGAWEQADPFWWPGHTGVACFLVHGLTSTPYEVRELGAHLHAAGHSVLAPLLPGHGRSVQELARTRWTEWAKAVEGAWKALHETHQHVVVGGSSLGAALAFWLAAHRPVAGVIGLGTPYRLAWRAYLAYPLRLVKLALPKRGGSSIADPEARCRHPSYVATPTSSLVEMIRLLRHVRARLPAVTAPVLLIHAWSDPVVPRQNALAVYRAVGSTDKQLVWVYRSAHIVTEDHDKGEVFAKCVHFVNSITKAESRKPRASFGRPATPSR